MTPTPSNPKSGPLDASCCHLWPEPPDLARDGLSFGLRGSNLLSCDDNRMRRSHRFLVIPISLMDNTVIYRINRSGA